ncbi:hypothetical protein BU25DRAFT_207193 [Macroventuria anomochaeta]|uniref:Uncharacterized protein n=1 Tax=Macroventuria anomochaeta TaxID=301207 RepID=A0ACB6RL43_9PLEO|nr:uncharacterized protein BU25DRAFT_207193 [Macroventuria anomochaeta]KAF2622631.1 hypothetical protein BU25DRAFT_207193 [Macroventuria anomochaeta]
MPAGSRVPEVCGNTSIFHVEWDVSSFVSILFAELRFVRSSRSIPSSEDYPVSVHETTGTLCANPSRTFEYGLMHERPGVELAALRRLTHLVLPYATYESACSAANLHHVIFGCTRDTAADCMVEAGESTERVVSDSVRVYRQQCLGRNVKKEMCLVQLSATWTKQTFCTIQSNSFTTSDMLYRCSFMQVTQILAEISVCT